MHDRLGRVVAHRALLDAGRAGLEAVEHVHAERVASLKLRIADLQTATIIAGPDRKRESFKDHELGYTVWHEEGQADCDSVFRGRSRGRGREFLNWIYESHRPMLIHAHQVSSILIEIDGEWVACESYVSVGLRKRANGRVAVV